MELHEARGDITGEAFPMAVVSVAQEMEEGEWEEDTVLCGGQC